MLEYVNITPRKWANARNLGSTSVKAGIQVLPGGEGVSNELPLRPLWLHLPGVAGSGYLSGDLAKYIGF